MPPCLPKQSLDRTLQKAASDVALGSRTIRRKSICDYGDYVIA